jgi:hypothetical protein
MGVSNDVDLLNPPPELEQKKHKLKRLVPSPNSFFYGKRSCALGHVFTLFSVVRILEVSFFPGVSYQTLDLLEW